MSSTHDDDSLRQCARRYFRYSLWLIAAVTLVALLAANIMYSQELIVPVVVSAFFSLATSMAYGVAWRSVARSAPKTLTRFYLAAPALRMMAAALVLVVYCVAVREAAHIRLFAIVFFVFYIVTLIFDSVYFARFEKLNKNHKE